MFQFEDGSFDVILDKGSLDALMGEDCPAAVSNAWSEVCRDARQHRADCSIHLH